MISLKACWESHKACLGAAWGSKNRG